MELRQLEYFTAVAEQLHFGKAADRLNIGQPAVSQQIRRLERELGVDLFDRSPRHVRLTQAGERLLPGARAVLAAVDQARAAVAPSPSASCGRTLRLGLCTGLGDHLDRILDHYSRLSPGVEIELVHTPMQERLDEVASGRLDAAFVRGTSQTHAVRVFHMWHEPLVAALPAAHPLARRSSVAVAELASLPLRLTSRQNNAALVDLIFSACYEADFAPTTASPFPGLDDTLAAIGVGAPTWTVVYAAHARLIQNRRVAFVPFRSTNLCIATGLAVRRGAAARHVRLLLEACTAAHLSNPGAAKSLL